MILSSKSRWPIRGKRLLVATAAWLIGTAGVLGGPLAPDGATQTPAKKKDEPTQDKDKKEEKKPTPRKPKPQRRPAREKKGKSDEASKDDEPGKNEKPRARKPTPRRSTRKSPSNKGTGKLVIPPEMQQRIDEFMESDQSTQTTRRAQRPTQRGRQNVTNRPTSRGSTRTAQRNKRPSQRSRSTRRGRTPSSRSPRGVVTGAADSGAALSIPPNDEGIPPEEGRYSFSIKDGTYQQLIEGINRQTGLAVTGEIPQGQVTFVTEEELTFDELLERVRVLLFDYKPLEPYWLIRHPTHLEVVRVNDYPRQMPLNRMFPSVEAFRAAHLPDYELVLVIYRPPSGSVADLQDLRLYLPDYVRTTPLEEQNRVAIFALARDVEKYLSMVDILGDGADDPRTMEIITVDYILPSEAVKKLELLMDLSSGTRRAVPSRRRGGDAAQLAAVSEPDVSIVPEDEQGVLIVRAMPEKVKEIKELLPLIDVDTSESFAPVVIKVQNADPAELVNTIQQVLAASGEPTTASTPTAASKRRTARRRRAVRRRAQAEVASMSTDDITILTHPAIKALIVVASDEDLARVRRLVELFDIETGVKHEWLELQYADPDEIKVTLMELLSVPSGPKGKVNTLPFQIVPDPSGAGLWFSGSLQDLETVKDMIAQIDVATERPTLHIRRLVNQKPSFVAQMLEQFDSGGGTITSSSATRSSRPKRRRRNRRRAATTAKATPVKKFTPDDEQGRLFVLCTKEEWEEYVPFIDELENAVKPRDYVLIAVEHIDPDEAIAKLQALMPDAGAQGEGGSVRFESTDDGILVMGASEADIETFRVLVGEFDRDVEIILRTFDIRYGDPAEIADAVRALLRDGVGPSKSGAKSPRRPRRRGRRRRPQQAAATATSGTAGSVETDLTIVGLGQRLIVQTTPPLMEQVAELIKQFDVQERSTEIKVYEDFPPGADIEDIADTLATAIGGSSRKGLPRAKGREADVASTAQFIPQPAVGKLVVIAEPSLFQEIEELLAVLRVGAEVSEIEVAFFPVEHADPQEVVEQVEPLLSIKVQRLIRAGELVEAPETDSSSAAMPKRAGRRRRMPARRAASAGDTEGFHLAADMRNHRIVVAAQKVVIDEAEKLIAAFDRPGDDDVVEIAYVNLQYADPASLIDRIDPLLAMKVEQLVEEGELSEESDAAAAPGVKQRRQRRARRSRDKVTRYHLEPDPQNQRIAIAAPQPVIEVAKTLIAEFDRPSEEADFVIVHLENAEPNDMVQSIKELMGAPVRQTTGVKRGKRRGAARAAATAGAGEEAFTITVAPGGEALVLRGSPQDIEEAQGWIERLDAVATSGRVINVYKIEHVDLKRLVDLIMASVSGPEERGRKRPRRAKQPNVRDLMPEDDFEEFVTFVEKQSDDVYVQADLIDNTMVVSTTATKMAQIDGIVKQFDTEEKAEEIQKAVVPVFTYALQYVDASTAALALEDVLAFVWEPSDQLPKVDYALFDDLLNVRYPDASRFPEIEELIRKFVDKPEKGGNKRLGKMPPKGMTPEQVALWFKMNGDNLDVELIDVSEQTDELWKGRRVRPPEERPCVLPSFFHNAVGALIADLARQVEPDNPADEPEDPPVDDTPAEEPQDAAEQEPEPEDVPPDEDQMDEVIRERARAILGDEAPAQEEPQTGKRESDAKGSKRKRFTGKAEKLKILYNNKDNTIVFEGEAGVIDGVPEMMDELKEELKDLEQPPDIRVYRMVHLDVYTAVDIINEMFNATSQQRAAMLRIQQQQQRRAQRQRQQQQRRRQQQQQQGRAGRGAQGGREEQESEQARGGAQLPEESVRVYPNPRDRTLILRAETSQYPALLELLATIDQPKPMDSTHRVFQLKKLNAVEVADLLSDWLGLDEVSTEPASTRRTSRRTSRRGARGSSASPAGGAQRPQLPRSLQAETPAGPLGVDPKDIKLSSNAENNTILAMAPKVALDYIEELINDLESKEIKERGWHNFELAYADATEVAEYLESRFGDGVESSSRRRGRGRRSSEGDVSSLSESPLTRATILPYPRLNVVSVQASDEQMEEIASVIEDLDINTDAFESITLLHTDAAVAADTLTAMFGASGSSRGGRSRQQGSASTGDFGPKFIGEAGGRILFYSAPAHLHDRIRDVVAKLEKQFESLSTVHVIELKHATPSVIADALESAYGGGSSSRRGRSSRGGSTGTVPPRVSVTAHDASKRLFVVTDDELYPEIEALVHKLDQETTLFDFKIYPLKYANARRIHETMTKLVTDYMKRMPRDTPLEPFAVQVEEKANALVVMGGPMVFGFVEDALKTIDIEANAASPPGVLMVPLKNADAAEVAQNITQLWTQRKEESQEPPPQAQANRALNVLIVRGTQAQLDEIKANVIDPIEEQSAQALKTETITLKHAQAQEVADLLSSIYEEKRQALQSMGNKGVQPPPLEMVVVITPDVATNQLIVQASDTNLAEIKEHIARLDTEEVAEASAIVTRVYSVRQSDAQAVVKIIQEWAKSRQQSKGRNVQAPQRDTIVAVAEPWTRTVVVTASKVNHARIKQMLEELDKESAATELQARVINLKNADAEPVASTLNEIFVRSAPKVQGAEVPISVSALKGSKAILVKCSDDDFEAIKAAVAELDREGAIVGEEVRVVTLLYADATEVQESMQKYLKKPGGSGAAGELVGDTRISVLTQTNALVVSGAKDRVGELVTIIRELDIAGEKGSVPQIMALTHATVGQILPTLQEMFVEGGTSRKGQTPPVIAANETLNALIVRAGPTDMAAIEATVKQLDTPDAAEAKPFRLISVAQGINVEDLAVMLEEAVNAAAAARPGAGRGREAPPVSITPDKRTSTLLVSGNPTKFDEVEQMVRSYEDKGPSKGVGIRVISIGGTPAEEIERLIATLKGESSGRSSSSRSRPSSRRPSSSRRRSNR